MFFRGSSKSPPKIRMTSSSSAGGGTSSTNSSTPPAVVKLYTSTPRSRSSSRDNTILSSASTTTNTSFDHSSSSPSSQLHASHFHHHHHHHLPESSSVVVPPAPPPIHTTTTTTTTRGRFNSRDLPRTYSGQYASCGNDHDLLMPLECLQQEQFLQAQVSTGVFFCIYLSIIFALQFISTVTIIAITGALTTRSSSGNGGGGHYYHHHRHHHHHNDYFWFQHLLPPFQHDESSPQLQTQDAGGADEITYPQSLSWTLTNLIHLIFSLMTIHFSKGSFLVVNQQGELNAMTVWEQLEATPESSTHMRRSLLLVPTILCYIAICVVNFEPIITLANVCIWCVAILPKLSFMNGVRLFGINRTAGIDDEIMEEDDTDDDNNNNTTRTEEEYQEEKEQQQQQRQQQLLFAITTTTTTTTSGTTTTMEEPVEGPSLAKSAGYGVGGGGGNNKTTATKVATVPITITTAATKKSQ